MRQKMQFKFSLLILAGLIVGLLVNHFYTPSAEAQIKLTYANFPPAPTFPCVQMERWKTEVEKRTGGKVKIDTYPGGTLLGAKNMFDGVISGIADIGTITLGYHPGRFPLSEIVDLHFGWPNATVASVTLWDLFEKYNFESLRKVKVITMFTTAPANIMSMKPIRSTADLKGYELRTVGSAVKVIELLGAKPIGMPMSEVPEALQKGIIKGIVTSLEVMKDFKFAEYLRFVTMANLMTFSWAAFMNQAKWDSLPTDVKKVIDDMGKEQAIWTGQYMDNHVKEAMKWSKETYKVETVNLSSGELTKWKNQLKPIFDYSMGLKEGDVTGKVFFEEMMRLKEKYSKKYGK